MTDESDEQPQRPDPDPDPTAHQSPGRRRDDAVRQEARIEVHAQRVLLINLALGALALWAIIATVTTVLLWLQTGRDQTALDHSNNAVSQANTAVQQSNQAVTVLRAAQRRQSVQLVNGCERLNVERATNNTSRSALFVLFKTVEGFSVRSERRRERRLRLHHKHDSRRDRHESKLFASTLQEAVVTLAWTPLTNCQAAVAISGSAYRAPLPVRFVDRQPPPSALSVKNAQLPQPVGSVS